MRLFVAMSAEAADDDSEARGFFAERYRWLLQEIADDVRKHQAEGQLSPHLDPDGVASLLVAAADGLQIQWLLNPESVDMGERFRALWSAFRALK